MKTRLLQNPEVHKSIYQLSNMSSFEPVSTVFRTLKQIQNSLKYAQKTMLIIGNLPQCVTDRILSFWAGACQPQGGITKVPVNLQSNLTVANTIQYDSRK